jgi:hypothetical protein
MMMTCLHGAMWACYVRARTDPWPKARHIDRRLYRTPGSKIAVRHGFQFHNVKGQS